MKKIYVIAAIVLVVSSCTVNNVTVDDGLKKYFDEYHVDGTFALYDNSRGQHTIYNQKRDTTRFLPASTFKIFNALVGLQTGKLLNDSAILKWDGIVRENRPEWNKDLSLYQAFRLSALPHFQGLARSIGKDTMQRYIDSVHYGNGKISKIDSFWIDNSLKISADEQEWFVKLLYFRQLPFRHSVQEQVKKMMIWENNATYQLAYKTGWGQTENGNELGWIVGWIEENRHVYFFAMNLETADHQIDMKTVRKKILDNILSDMGFFKGKM
ncbi:MAG: class D beta-lactamase [Chitinophagaceae bacterium]